MANGLMAYLLQITIDATNKYIDFHWDGSDYSTAITEGVYADIHAVLAALVAEMDIATSGGSDFASNSAVIINAGNIGHVHIEDLEQEDVRLYWKTGINGSDNMDRHIGTVLGFDDSADDTGEFEYDADWQHMHGFYDIVGPQFDSRSRKQKIGPGTFESVSGKCTRTVVADHVVRKTEHAWIAKERMFAEFADPNEDYETWWDEAAGAVPFKIYSDTDDWTDEGTWCLLQSADEDMLDGIPRLAPGAEYYSITMRLKQQPTDPDVIT